LFVDWKRLNKPPYVDVVDQHSLFRHYLTDVELQEIGEFTRGNVAMFLNSRNRPYCWNEHQPVRDFRAVCDNIDIPWAEEKYRWGWDEHFPWGVG
jgi:hypothetical protein